MKFAGRLVAGTVLVLVATMAVVVLAADRALRADLEHDLRVEIEREAQLVRDALPDSSDDWQAAVARLAGASEHRITLIDTTGRVVGESQAPDGGMAVIPNQGERPEVLEALAGRVGSSRRLSATTDIFALYAAIPGGPGVVRIASDLTVVDRMIRTAQRSVLGAALFALVIGVLLATLAGRSIARPLHQITTAAQAMTQGTPPRFPRSSVPDIDTLVQALREMHEQLGSRFAELQQEQAESAALVNAMVEGVIASDGRGRIVRANPAARQLLGYGNETLPDLEQLFRVKAAREVVVDVLAGAPVLDRELELDSRTLLVNARPLPGGGAVLVLHDLTTMRRLETVRADFVANVSHELKTPLTSISGYAETLLSDPPDAATTRRFLETIHSNARRMQHLVDDQLDLARIESGRWQPRIEALDTAATARDAWAACADRAAAKGVRYAQEVEAGAATLPVDADAIRQVLVNLFDNAIRHTPAGGAITLSARARGAGIELAVADTGSGIGHEHLPRIFERFYRADPSRSRAEGGTGLGLAIVKHFIEAHKGTVRSESTVGRG
ncbi:MAG: histidine kinase dimerization/phospho-acceptor domain-containing protein, partial [Gemmatimonadota bacterium]|nr:histidine kinase dimerization/phospho-acceptor domain-containing protein [Gemmatimonadota bacterium]